MTFSVSPGEIFGFLGPSGAGKSTLQKVLTGMLASYQGSAMVNRRKNGTAAPKIEDGLPLCLLGQDHILHHAAVGRVKAVCGLVQAEQGKEGIHMSGLIMRFPKGKAKALTLSYDDGVEQDIRLMDIMDKNGLKGCRCRRGMPFPG